MSYIIVSLLIGFILLIHETGHFLFARMTGIPVERFSLGFGPRLTGFRRGETDFFISLIPFGGYVMPKVASEEEFFRYSPRKRILFSLGGPLANLLSVPPILAMYNVVTGGVSFSGLFIHPFIQTVEYTERILTSIPLIFSQPQQLSGIIGILSEGSRVIGMGLSGLLALAAFLSINLAILNLLPIPALDGGNILMTIIERFWPQSTKVRLPLALIGWLILLSAMVYATTQDISRLLG